MNNQPFFSIGIPAYNTAKWIGACIDSIFAQNFSDFELICVDDGSSDDSLKVLQQYAEKDSRITVIHQENMGLGGARNSGMEIARGEYLYFIDSDDYIPDGAVSTILEAIDKYNADVYVFPFRLVDEAENDLGVCRDGQPTFTPLCPKETKSIITGYPNAWNKVARASLYKDNGITFPSRVWYEDIRTTPKMFSKADKVVYLEKDMYNYLQREGSIMNNAKVERNIEIIDALSDLVDWFKKEGLYEEYKEELEYLIIDHVFVAGSVRVIRSAGTKHPLIETLREFTYSNVSPDSFKTNKYVVSSMARNRKLIMKLLCKNMRSAVKLIFKIKK